jgi:succinate dehydrogenase/fumarate reductase cytochrome b subunit
MRDRLIKLQAISGLIFFAFVGVHLMNTWAAAGGAELYDGLQGLAQFLYQAWVVEALILTALGVHVACGIARMKQRRAPTPGRRARWHRYAGIFLMVVVAGHIAAVRGPSWFLDVYPGFAGVSFSLAFAPAFFYPYYFVLGVAGFYHGVNGALVAAGRLGWPAAGLARRLPVATAVAALLMVVALASFGGFVGAIDDPFDNDFARLGMGMLNEVF